MSHYETVILCYPVSKRTRVLRGRQLEYTEHGASQEQHWRSSVVGVTAKAVSVS